MNEKNLYGIVGSGRMAKHFCQYLQLSNVPHIVWSRRADGDVSPYEKLGQCKLVVLLISDGAIADFLEQYPQLKQCRLVHFSGSLLLADVPSYHPLMSFTDNLYTLAEYEKIPFVYEQGKPSFTEIFPELGNSSFAIAASQKPLYHALCVLSGNFTVMLWQKVFADFEDKLGLKAKILLPYMQKVCQNLEKDWRNSLTGPLARGDEQTIRKNLDSLSGDVFQKVYGAFVQTLDKGGKYECD